MGGLTPYSPDLAPTDFHLFRPLNNYLYAENVFRNNEEVKKQQKTGEKMDQPKERFTEKLRRSVE